MTTNREVKTIVNLLLFGVPAVTIFLMIGNVTDPVNTPKFVVLGCVAGACLPIIIRQTIRKPREFGKVEYAVVFFAIWSLIASVKSGSPLSQNLYGVFGRNTGWLTYFFLGIILVSAAGLRQFSTIRKFTIAMLVTGLINVAYSAWVLLFGDFVGWRNQYGAILGTFGNPNFISSFLGIVFTLLCALAYQARGIFRLLLIGMMPLVIWELLSTDSLQGLVIASIGFWLTSLMALRAKFPLREVFWQTYAALGFTIGFTAALGAFRIGPLTSYLWQPTVALRQQYWYAAWKMALKNPIFGVGMDGYGDWFRRARGMGAIANPGPNIVSNAAHNVFLDILASGGFPLLGIYLVITGLGLKAIVRIFRESKKYDPTFVTLSTTWLTYQTQSIISINQIGLAVWGWLITGLLIGYERIYFNSSLTDINRAKLPQAERVNFISPRFLASFGLAFGFLISSPPLFADMNWRNIQLTGSAAQLPKTFSGSYFSPLNSANLLSVVQILEENKLFDLSAKYARLGVKFNPENCDAWHALYFATKTSELEKQKAKIALKRLDPLNPEWRLLN